jgi:UDP-N-acetylglucosamine--N-acetylmuramyl-(pentapeptide) pyrophosphoryl-undecaprenol N-acetylglucosamine transferase
VIHQAGERHYQHTADIYRQQGVTAQVRAFIDDMAQTYAWADLVICRSGALTVSELAAAGVGAVFVPFPAAVDDHQTRNAQFLVSAEAALLIAERDLSAQRLAQELTALFSAGRERLASMARNARARAIVDADVRLADACVAVAGGAA